MPPAVFLHPGWIWCLYWRGKEAQGACFMEGEAAAGCWVCSQWLWGPESSLRQFFPGGSSVVPGGIRTHRVRLRLLQALAEKGAVSMNIVVWKSPKALRGILRRLFGVKAGE